MILPIPAIDIIAGKVVRLEKGDYERLTIFGDSPLAVARKWEAEGAPMLHVVDLEGARLGRPVNLRTIRKIVKGVHIPVQVGGGIRTVETMRRYLDLGAERVVVGSVAVSRPEDIVQVKAIEGIEGIILGKALYTSALRLPEVITMLQGE